jgi:hypothetical protein
MLGPPLKNRKTDEVEENVCDVLSYKSSKSSNKEKEEDIKKIKSSNNIKI